MREGGIELTGEVVLGYLGWPSIWWKPGETEDDPPLIDPRVESSLNIAMVRARSYTRGRGFGGTEDDPPRLLVAHDLATAVLTATVRVLLNPEQYGTVHQRLPVTMGSEVVERRLPPHDWTLAERLVLDRYRKRAL